jgi:hypothetical protein
MGGTYSTCGEDKCIEIIVTYPEEKESQEQTTHMGR